MGCSNSENSANRRKKVRHFDEPGHAHFLTFSCYRRMAVAWLRENSPEFLEKLTVRHRNRTYRRFWQAGPGQDRNVYEPAAAHKIAEYIHTNPVRRGLVERAEDWPWSSARDWSGEEDVVLKVDRTVPGLDEFTA